MSEQQSRADAEGSHLRIVIAEDSPTQAAFLEHSLVRRGCSVTVACDGGEALEAVRSELPDLLVSDVIMPVMDGYALCRAVKSDPATAGVRVVLATQMTDCADVLRGMAAGADDFLSKPYDAADLDSRIFNARRFEDSVGGDVVLEYRGEEHVFGGDPAHRVNFMLSALEEAEKRLRLQRESEQRTNLLLNSMVEGLAVHEVIVDESGSAIDYRFLDVNPAFEALTGLKAGEVVGRTVLEVLPEIEPFWIERYGRVALTGEPVQFEHYARSFGRHYQVSAYCPEKGRFATVFTDVTDRIQAASELQRSTATLQAAMDQSPAGIIIADAKDGRLSYVNEAGLAIRGSDRATVLDGIGIADYPDAWRLADLDGRPLEAGETPLARAVTSGVASSREYLIGREDGEDRVVLGSAAPIRDDAGQVTSGIVVFTDLTELRRTESDLARSNARLGKMVYEVAEAMGRVVECRDPYTQGHQERVARLARRLAVQMGLPEDEIESVQMAAIVHDIGKLVVPTEILSKPGSLSTLELALIKEHPQEGYEILKGIEFPWPVADAVLQHHERLDGTGYPSGLRSGDICLGALILGVADVVEAMASDRPYRPAIGLDAALAEIADHPERYDRTVSQALVRIAGEVASIIQPSTAGTAAGSTWARRVKA